MGGHVACDQQAQGGRPGISTTSSPGQHLGGIHKRRYVYYGQRREAAGSVKGASQRAPRVTGALHRARCLQREAAMTGGLVGSVRSRAARSLEAARDGEHSTSRFAARGKNRQLDTSWLLLYVLRTSGQRRRRVFFVSQGRRVRTARVWGPYCCDRVAEDRAPGTAWVRSRSRPTRMPPFGQPRRTELGRSLLFDH